MSITVPNKKTVISVAIIAKVLITIVLIMIFLAGIAGFGIGDVPWRGYEVKNWTQEKKRYYNPKTYEPSSNDPFALVGGMTNVIGNTTQNNPGMNRMIQQNNRWLGMNVESLTPMSVRMLNLPANSMGVMIMSAPFGSVAEQSGLMKGDVILAVNEQMIANKADYIKATSNGTLTQANLEVNRSGRQMVVTVPNGRLREKNITMNQQNMTQPNTAPPPTEKTWLGMELEKLTPIKLQKINMPQNTTGILIDSAPIGSVAGKAGVMNNDILTAVNNQPMGNMADLIKATNNGKLKQADIQILRNGRTLNIAIPGNRMASQNQTVAQQGFNRNWNQPSPQQINQNNMVTQTPMNMMMNMGQRENQGQVQMMAPMTLPVGAANVMPAVPLNTLTVPMVTGQVAQPLPNYIPTVIPDEGHWQGMDVWKLTAELRQKLLLPEGLNGLLVDGVSLHAAKGGLKAGDVITFVEQDRVSTLAQFERASRKVRSNRQATLTIMRRRGNEKQNGRYIMNNLAVLLEGSPDLGFAQLEGAPMILPGAGRPHPPRGPCTNCHTIGTGLELPDPDLITLPPPPIPFFKMVNKIQPHRDRGPCEVCHVIMQ